MIGFAELAVIPVIRNTIKDTGMSARMFSAYSALVLSTSVMGGYSFVKGVNDFYSRHPMFETECQPRIVQPLPGIRDNMFTFKRAVADGYRDFMIDARKRSRKEDVKRWVNNVLENMGVEDADVEVVVTDRMYFTGDKVNCRLYMSAEDMR